MSERMDAYAGICMALEEEEVDREEIAETWRIYCEKLYAENEEINEHEIKEYEEEPFILQSEITSAIHKLKNNKSPGNDKITSEILKGIGEEGT
ncbi:hypothetical protein HHI36_018791 [Cryptolaemus montrouzieri]|uniref:Uncharacterized protein n=2 Tax=Cryptolaemus montrouzieri TaxID=559131 RepID=A0ABD2P1R4_9CUCU